MMANRVTIHHEGAGKPRDSFTFLEKRYSGGVGLTRYELVRSPHESFVTRGQGGVRSLQVCFSGDRRFYELSDNDLVLLRALVDDARARGWVTDRPDVFLHGDTDKGTECPGGHVKARRAAIENACRVVPTSVVLPASGGEMAVLPVKYPPAKVGKFPTPFYSHNDDHILAYNGAAVGGDIAAFGIRVKKVPVNAGHKIVGLTYGINADGTTNPRKVVAYASDGGVYVYDAT